MSHRHSQGRRSAHASAWLVLLTVTCLVTFSSVGFNQEQVVRVPGAVYDADFPNEKPGPGAAARSVRNLGAGPWPR